MHLPCPGLDHGIEKAPVPHQRLPRYGVAVLRQEAAQRLRPALGLEQQGVAAVGSPGGPGQDLGDVLAPHAGDDDGVALLRRHGGQTVTQAGRSIRSPTPSAPAGLLRPVQGAATAGRWQWQRPRGPAASATRADRRDPCQHQRGAHPGGTQAAICRRRGVSSRCFAMAPSCSGCRRKDAYGCFPVCVPFRSILAFLLASSFTRASSLSHVHAVDHTGLLHSLAPGRGAAQAVHADGQEDGRGLRRHVQNVTDDGVLLDLDHQRFLQF